MSDEISQMQERIAKLKAKQEAQKRLNQRDVKIKNKPETLSMSVSSSERFHGLDFLRAMAMLMGLVFHAPMLYYIPIMADGFQDFGVSQATMPPMESWLNATVYWLHSWRMTVFFMISMSI